MLKASMDYPKIQLSGSTPFSLDLNVRQKNMCVLRQIATCLSATQPVI